LRKIPFIEENISSAGEPSSGSMQIYNNKEKTPKGTILPLFIHPFFLLWNIKEDILRNVSFMLSQ